MAFQKMRKLMCSYLKDGWQTVGINKSFSLCKKFKIGVLQGSIDDPLLF